MTRKRSKGTSKLSEEAKKELETLVQQQREDDSTDEFDRVYAVEHHAEVIGRGCFRRLPSTRD